MSKLPLRFITAASLFDGHDAAINIMRRLIQDRGVEVIHLGHNRSVDDVLNAAIQEDADAICLSSYQGGHTEYFKFLIDRLKELGAEHIAVFGGGGGTITPDEIKDLHSYGVEQIYHPNDGMKLGLVGMIDDVIERANKRRICKEINSKHLSVNTARTLSSIEDNAFDDEKLNILRKQWSAQKQAPVMGITGTGGAGKSSLTDEILNRFTQYLPNIKIAVLAVDPTRRRTGGALLGDRIRMNSLRNENLFMRSIATRRQNAATSIMLSDSISYLKSSEFDLVIVETAGIGQSDSEIVDFVDVSTYVMTSEFGAASQLEKIDMLDFADAIVINKFEKPGSSDALRDVRKQWRRNHNSFSITDDEVPVFPTIASQFNDPGVNWLFENLIRKLSACNTHFSGSSKLSTHFEANIPQGSSIIPGNRKRYLSDISDSGRHQDLQLIEQSEIAQKAQNYFQVLTDLKDPLLPSPLCDYQHDDLDNSPELSLLRQKYQSSVNALNPELKSKLIEWPKNKDQVQQPEFEYQVRQNIIKGENYRTSLSGLPISKVAVPRSSDWGSLIVYLGKENLPGHYPYTAGVFPYRREGEDPIRMFAGEGTPERTNRRFHYLSFGQPAARLSTAFDSVTLYGENPAIRPDIYGKIGNSGVSIASVDDMKKLYCGFDLCAASTSVSMTINGPAPIVLAFFMNAAIDQQVEKHLKDNGLWDATEEKINKLFSEQTRPMYAG